MDNQSKRRISKKDERMANLGAGPREGRQAMRFSIRGQRTQFQAYTSSFRCPQSLCDRLGMRKHKETLWKTSGRLEKPVRERKKDGRKQQETRPKTAPLVLRLPWSGP